MYKKYSYSNEFICYIIRYGPKPCLQDSSSSGFTGKLIWNGQWIDTLIGTSLPPAQSCNYPIMCFFLFFFCLYIFSNNLQVIKINLYVIANWINKIRRDILWYYFPRHAGALWMLMWALQVFIDQTPNRKTPLWEEPMTWKVRFRFNEMPHVVCSLEHLNSSFRWNCSRSGGAAEPSSGLQCRRSARPPEKRGPHPAEFPSAASGGPRRGRRAAGGAKQCRPPGVQVCGKSRRTRVEQGWRCCKFFHVFALLHRACRQEANERMF